jgi:hypothetical protein
VVGAAKLLIEGEYLTSPQFLECCRIAITELETQIRKANEYTSAETDNVMRKVIGHLIDVKPNKDKLVYDPKPPKPEELANAKDELGPAAQKP